MVSIDGDTVRVQISLSLQQNLTILTPAFTLPVINTHLEGANASSAHQAVEDAVKAKVPAAFLQDLVVDLSASDWNNQTQTQWFNITLAFGLTGLTARQGLTQQVDMAWKSFVTTSNLTAGGVSFNMLGAKYLAGPAKNFGSTQGGFASTKVIVDDFPVAPQLVTETVSKVVALDFSLMSDPVSKWSQSWDLGSQTMTLSVDDQVRRALWIALSISESQFETITLDYVLQYRLSAELTSPGRSYTEGDLVTFDIDGPEPVIMAVLILSVTGFAAATFVIERRLTRSPSQKFSRRRPRK